MRLRVLGSSGAEFPGKQTPGFLVDDGLLLDAGTIGAVLNEDEQWAIKHILLTHAHLDHIKGIPFLADNIILKNSKHQVRIKSIDPILKTLKDNLLNNAVWPDFTAIPNRAEPVIKLNSIEAGREYGINGYRVTAHEVNHSVPAVGYVVEDADGRRLLYTGDTGPTDAIWAECDKQIHVAIIEVSMPNEMEEMALMTGHMTSDLLRRDLEKMGKLPERILITHPKPQYVETIRKELSALGRDNIHILSDGEIFEV